MAFTVRISFHGADVFPFAIQVTEEGLEGAYCHGDKKLLQVLIRIEGLTEFFSQTLKNGRKILK